MRAGGTSLPNLRNAPAQSAALAPLPLQSTSSSLVSFAKAERPTLHGHRKILPYVLTANRPAVNGRNKR